MKDEQATDQMAADASAAIVVLLISIPLSMGIAIASGAPPALGLVTAAVGGLVVGFFAGCPLQITGPSAGLAVMVMDAINSYGIESLWVVGITAGLMQIAAGRLRLGQLFRAVSPAVIRGMLSGIGVLIFAAQFHVMVDDKPKGSGLENLLTIPQAIYKGTIPQPSGNHRTAAAIGVLTLLVIIVVQLFKKHLPKNLQAPLVAVVVATAVSQAMGLDIKYVSLGGNPFINVTFPDVAWLTANVTAGLIGTGLALGFVASAETLLCAGAVDQMSGGRSDFDKELFAQGMGNLCCGIFGAPPVTGVITRSTANVEAGARTRRAAVGYGAGLILMVSMFPGLLETIPYASLAGVLVYIGYKLVYSTPLSTLRRYGRSEVAIYVATVVSIVGINLLKGLMIGFALSIAKLLYTFSHLEVRVEETDDGQAHVHLDGSATFMRLPYLAAQLDELTGTGVFYLHVQDLDYIDHACLDLIGSWETRIESEGGRVFIEWGELAGKYHKKNQRVDASAKSLPRETGDVTHLYGDAVGSADILELEAGHGFEEAVGLAAEALGKRIGVDPEELSTTLMDRATRGGCVVLRGIAIPHVHVPDLEAPQVVLVRSAEGLAPPEGLGEETIYGFFFLASPEGAAAQHLHMLSQLARRMGDSGFQARWRSAPGADDLRECLLLNQRMLALRVDSGTTTGDLVGVRVRELSESEECVVSVVIRGDTVFLPHGGSRVDDGDQVVLIGETTSIEKVRARYGLTSTPPRRPGDDAVKGAGAAN
jgi:MFS superfamily sulfate permease-like transporter/mannitol/fructose-specific phosphotransferase system IIA component (Ntr-type)